MLISSHIKKSPQPKLFFIVLYTLLSIILTLPWAPVQNILHTIPRSAHHSPRLKIHTRTVGACALRSELQDSILCEHVHSLVWVWCSAGPCCLNWGFDLGDSTGTTMGTLINNTTPPELHGAFLWNVNKRLHCCIFLCHHNGVTTVELSTSPHSDLPLWKEIRLPYLKLKFTLWQMTWWSARLARNA